MGVLVGAGIYGRKRTKRLARLKVEVQLAEERLARAEERRNAEAQRLARLEQLAQRLARLDQLAGECQERLDAEAQLRLELGSFSVDEVAALSTDARADFDYLCSFYGVPLPSLAL